MNCAAHRTWVKQAEVDGGVRPATTASDANRVAQLERKNRELRRANTILEQALVFCGGDRPPHEEGTPTPPVLMWISSPLTRNEQRCADSSRRTQRLNWARNRVNHCESVVFGFPQPGQAQGIQLRHSPAGIIEDCRVLVGRFSGEVEAWMRASTAVDQLVAHPLAQQALAYSARQSGLSE